MDQFLILLTVFISTVISIKLLIPIAWRIGLLDVPCTRKDHTGSIPLVGGLSVFIGVLISSLFWLPDSIDLRIYLIASAMMVFVGSLDDRHDLSVKIRLIAQLLIASLMIFSTGHMLSDLGDLLGAGEINLGWLGIPFTYLAVLGAMNAFNMMDGIDGLLGMMSINTLAAIAILCTISQDLGHVQLAVIIITAIVTYLIFNLQLLKKCTSKIFMGDAGSMFIGLSVVWLLAVCTQADSATSTASFRAVTALWIIAIPLMDMAAIMIRRKRKGLSPFDADRDHLHHIVLRAGGTDRQALLIISLAAILLSAIGIAGEIWQVPEWIMFVLFLLLFAAYYTAYTHIWKVVRFIRNKWGQSKIN